MNNAMELRAVIEALRIIPEGMHVWISTDSAHVKKGITEWMGTWIKRGWKTVNGTPVANKTLWQSLIENSKRHSRIEWSWVKEHSGILLNECADVLATRGIFNQTPPNGTPQTVTSPVENTVNEEYSIEDGKETLHADWKAEHPRELTYLWLNGNGFRFVHLFRTISVVQHSGTWKSVLHRHYLPLLFQFPLK
jgi:ribonuclease HI